MARTTDVPELPYLEAFHAVCAEGGFTAAARRLGCTQPAVSYQVRRLERTIGAKLIERGGRRVLLTPAGERLRVFCRDFFAELAAVRSVCASGHRLEPLRIGSASGFGRYVLMPALRRLGASAGERAPELRVRFDTADYVLRGLEAGDFEAVFVYTRRISNRLRYRAVYDEELVLIAPAAWTGDACDLEALGTEPFVTYDEGDYVFGRWFDANFAEQPSALTSAAHFSELEEVIEEVARGAGLSIAPRDAVERHPRSSEVRIEYVGRGEPCMNQVFMVVRAGSVERPELSQVADLLRAPRGT